MFVENVFKPLFLICQIRSVTRQFKQKVAHVELKFDQVCILFGSKKLKYIKLPNLGNFFTKTIGKEFQNCPVWSHCEYILKIHFPIFSVHLCLQSKWSTILEIADIIQRRMFPQHSFCPVDSRMVLRVLEQRPQAVYGFRYNFGHNMLQRI